MNKKYYLYDFQIQKSFLTERKVENVDGVYTFTSEDYMVVGIPLQNGEVKREMISMKKLGHAEFNIPEKYLLSEVINTEDSFLVKEYLAKKSGIVIAPAGAVKKLKLAE